MSIEKTILDALKSIGVKIKPGLATDVERLKNAQTSFNLDLSKFGAKADPEKMYKLIETDVNFLPKATEEEKEQFLNNINYLKSEHPDLFKKEEPLMSAKTGEKLKTQGQGNLGPLTETESSLGVTSPEHQKLVKEYLDAKKQHLDAVKEANDKFNDFYKKDTIPMKLEAEHALENELKQKGLTSDQIYEVINNASIKGISYDPFAGKIDFREMHPEEYYRSIQDELKNKHGIDHSMDFYINFANQLKKPEFAKGGRVGYSIGGDVAKAAAKALEKAKDLKLKWSKAIDNGDWMSAGKYKEEADKIEAGHFLNKNPKDVTYEDVLDYIKATKPDVPSRYPGVEGEHWIDRARNFAIQKTAPQEGVGSLQIKGSPETEGFKKGGRAGYFFGGIPTSLTPKSITSNLGRTLENGIGSMFKKKRR